jgi:hypothetical protein
MRNLLLAGILGLLSGGTVHPVAAQNPPQREPPLLQDYVAASVTAVPESLGFHPFYRKYTDALGIPILSSEKVPDAALLVARDIVNRMLAGRPDLRRAMMDRNWRVGVMAEAEITGDIPEHATGRGRARRPANR